MVTMFQLQAYYITDLRCILRHCWYDICALHRWIVSVAHDAYAANLCSCSEISTLSLQDSNATIMSGHMNRPSLVEGSCLSVDKKLFETPDAVTEMVGQKLWPWLGCRWRWCRGCLADTGTDSMDGTFTAWFPSGSWVMVFFVPW